VNTRPVEVTVAAKVAAARVPAAMAIVKNCLIGESPFRRKRHEIARGYRHRATDRLQNVTRLKGMQISPRIIPS